MQPTSNATYQSLLQRLGQLTGSAFAYPLVPTAMPAPAPLIQPDQVVLSPSAQAVLVASPPPQAVLVPSPPLVIPYAPQVPVMTATPFTLPTASNPLGVAWIEAPVVVTPQASVPANPLGVSWLEMTVPAVQPAPQAPAAKPEPKPESKPPESKAKEAPKPVEKAKSPPAAKPTATYTVKGGDTLSQIAQATLGSSGRWPELYELNKGVIGSNPNVIRAGMVLTLPGGASAPKPTPATSATSRAGSAPYINQYSPAGSSAGYWNGPANCGPTSMAIIARAFGYGKNMSDAKLINHLGSMGGTNGNGTNVSGIAAMAKGIGKTAVTKGPGPQVDWIASELRAGKLVVANGDYHAMYPHINNSRTSGHYVAVVGLDAQGRFLVHDPAWKNGGAPIALTRDQLTTFIRSNPNGGWQISIG